MVDQNKPDKIIDNCYSKPREVLPSDRRIVYLVLTIGLAMARPSQGTVDADIVDRLRRQGPHLSASFSVTAKSLSDHIYGLEDGDLWSVQALALMSVYMLVDSKRNAAYAYCNKLQDVVRLSILTDLGMAIRSAFPLGLDQMEHAVDLFKNNQVALRKNIWRSLFVLDHFLAASLGRPLAISEDQCQGSSLDTPKRPPTLMNSQEIKLPTRADLMELLVHVV